MSFTAFFPLQKQKEFVKLMNKHGSNMDTKKIHMYHKRGKLPKETMLIGNKPCWFKEDTEKYITENHKVDG